MTGRVRQAGSPVPKVSDTEPVPSPVVTRKMTFVEALDIDMPVRDAFEKCDPARFKDITYDRLNICVDGGLNRDEIIQAFGTTNSSLVKAASKVKFKFSKIKPGPEPVELQPEIVPEPEKTEPASVITEPDVSELAESVQEMPESVIETVENVIETADPVIDAPGIMYEASESEAAPDQLVDKQLEQVKEKPPLLPVELVLLNGNKIKIELPERMVKGIFDELKQHQRQYRGIFANHVDGELIAVDLQEVVMMEVHGLDMKNFTTKTSIEQERYKVDCQCGAAYFCILGAGRIRARCRVCNDVVIADRNAETVTDQRDGVPATLMTNKYFVESYTPLAQRCDHEHGGSCQSLG